MNASLRFGVSFKSVEKSASEPSSRGYLLTLEVDEDVPQS
jgi:hypothetical protein